MLKATQFVLATVLVTGYGTALAEHGKVGAWHLETQTKAADPHGVFPTMPAMQVLAIKDAFRHHTSTDYCMDAATVAADVVVVPGCSFGPTTVSGQSMRATYTCQGKN